MTPHTNEELEPFRGNYFTIELAEGAAESYTKAIAQVPGTKRGCIKQLIALVKRFANFGKLRSPDQMRAEGDAFFAIKARCGLRAYGWYHKDKKRVFVISHVILKKRDKLSACDKDKMIKNRETHNTLVERKNG